MRRQTCGCVTCAKLSRQNTDPSISDTLTRHFLKQNYPKDISDIVYKILIKKLSYHTFVGIGDFPEIGFPVVKVENFYC